MSRIQLLKNGFITQIESWSLKKLAYIETVS